MSGPEPDASETRHAGAVHAEEHREGEEAPPPGARTMAAVRWGLVGAMALVALVSLLAALRPGGLSGLFGAGGTQESGTLYQCPMHPSVVQDHPGECPICSMTLVPRAAGGGSEQAAGHGLAAAPRGAAPAAVPGATEAPRSDVAGLVGLELPLERIQLAGIRTAPVARAALEPELRTVGYVAAAEDRVARLHTRVAGWIEDLAVNRTGDRVARGQVLAAVYSPDLLAAQQELLNALRWARDARAAAAAPAGGPHEGRTAQYSLADDARRRLELLGVSPAEIGDIERAGRPTRAVKLRSPADGWVTRKSAVVGSYVEPGTELFEIADLSTVWVLADVYEHEAARVHAGQRARFRPVALAGREFPARIQFVYPTIDARTRTLRVRLELANPGLELKPGMYGDVAIDLDPAEGVIVPVEAVVDTGTAQFVFLALGGGRFAPRRVRPGTRSESSVEVLEGLSGGETVVTTGNFLLDSESRLRAAIAGLGAEGAPVPKPAAAGGADGLDCERDFDRSRYAEKYEQCRACEIQHRGMGDMELDCKNAIPKPWR